jgi:hypothetical protein
LRSETARRVSSATLTFGTMVTLRGKMVKRGPYPFYHTHFSPWVTFFPFVYPPRSPLGGPTPGGPTKWVVALIYMFPPLIFLFPPPSIHNKEGVKASFLGFLNRGISWVVAPIFLNKNDTPFLLCKMGCFPYRCAFARGYFV